MDAAQIPAPLEGYHRPTDSRTGPDRRAARSAGERPDTEDAPRGLQTRNGNWTAGREKRDDSFVRKQFFREPKSQTWEIQRFN